MKGVSWKGSKTGVWVALVSGAIVALLVVAAALPSTADADAGGDTGSDSRRCHRDAFKALVAFVQRGVEPPRSGFVPKSEDGDVVNECSIEATAPRR